MTPEQHQHARDVLATIEANLEHFDMDNYFSSESWEDETWSSDPNDWDCGTTACIAGISALLKGWRPAINAENFICVVHSDTREQEATSQVARDNLGIADGYQQDLFMSNNERGLRLLTAAVETGNWDHLAAT